VGQTMYSLIRPTSFFESCQRRYGEWFTLRTPLERTLVFTTDPAVVREIFRGDPAIFHAGEANDILGPVLGASSVLLADEDEHLRQRRLLLPPFHGERINRYRAAMAEIAEREVIGWPRGRRFASLPSMQAITLKVIMRVVFGAREARATDELTTRMRTVLDALGSRSWLLLLTVTSSSRGRRSPWGRFRAKVAAVDELLADEIRARQQDPAIEERDDVLSLLLQARDRDGSGLDEKTLRDQLRTILVAGHETTATALAWTLERMVREPAVVDRAQAAARSEDDGYIAAVAKEALRLRPVVPVISRLLKQPVELGGWRLPAGVYLNPCVYLLHRRPDIYPDPTGFRPDRFLDSPPANYEWIPFGGGVRRCLGASFALLEMQTVLKVILATWRLRPEGRASESFIRRAITFAPRQGGRIAVEAAS
jgi:cytochrome P450